MDGGEIAFMIALVVILLMLIRTEPGTRQGRTYRPPLPTEPPPFHIYPPSAPPGTLRPIGLPTRGDDMPRLPSVLERDFQDQVIQLARTNGWKVAHFRPARVRDPKTGKDTWRTPVQGDGEGFPDLIMLRGHQRLVVELKTDTGQVSAAQQAWIDAFRAADTDTRIWRPTDWPEIARDLARHPRPPKDDIRGTAIPG